MFYRGRGMHENQRHQIASGPGQGLDVFRFSSINQEARLKYKAFRRNNSAENRIRYEAYNTRLGRLLKQAKIKYFKKKFEECKDNPQKSWRTINSYFRGKCRSGTLIPDQVNLTVDEINEHFANLGYITAKRILNGVTADTDLPEPRTTFITHLEPPSSDEVINLINSLEINIPAGCSETAVSTWPPQNETSFLKLSTLPSIRRTSNFPFSSQYTKKARCRR